jgi:hypothetical protein
MSPRHDVLVLAVYLSARGFAFVIFERPESPVDWGIKEMRRKDKNERCITAIGQIIDRYRPGVLVLQDTSLHGTRRVHRIRRLNLAITKLAETLAVKVITFARRQVMQAFANVEVGTKRQLAEAIAIHIPEFERYLPPVRKPWMSEDSRMSLFEAAALARAFFQSSDVAEATP